MKEVLEKRIAFLSFLVVLLLVVLGFLNIFSFMVYSDYNNLSPFTLSYLVYSTNAPVLSVTSMTHNHVMKPLLLPLKILFPGIENFYGLDLALVDFMPQWFFPVWFLAFIFYAAFLLCSIFLFSRFVKKWPKEILFPLTWLFVCAFFLVTKTIIDGGIFTEDFLVGAPFFLYLLLGNPKTIFSPVKNYFKFCFLPTFIFNLIPATIYLISGGYPFDLMITGVIMNLIIFSGFLTFALIPYFLIYLIQKIKYGLEGLNAKKKKGEKKKNFIFVLLKENWKRFLAVIFLLIFFISMIFFLNVFFKRNYIGPFEEMTAPIKKGDRFYVTPDALRDFSKFKVIGDSKEMILIEAKEETTLAQVSTWPNNIKAMQYAIKWKFECDFFSLPKEIKIITNDKFSLSELRARIPQGSMFKYITIDECQRNSDCTYKMQLGFDYSEECLAEFRIPVEKLLIKMGFTNFILT
ncbi:MAG: hypothetical protein NTZ73_02425 [Candidatus Diapherotrites archaeon]|nr:hypothetical protein [Candidatus Diapherotrites archaeon]